MALTIFAYYKAYEQMAFSFLNAVPGAHNPERATAINSCNGVFTSEFIFRQAFPAKNDCCRLDLFTVGCFEDDFDFPLRELCVVADDVDVPGSFTF